MKALLLLLLVMTPACVLFGLEHVPCTQDSDCPEGACDLADPHDGRCNGDPVAPPGPQPLASDGFDAEGRWPGPWSCSGGDVEGNGEGRITLSSSGRRDCQRRTAADVDIRVDAVRPAHVDTSAHRGLIITLRRHVNDDQSLAEMAFVISEGSSCGVCAYFVAPADATASSADIVDADSSNDGFPFGPTRTLNEALAADDAQLSIRARLENALLRAKVWGRGDVEPTDWTIEHQLPTDAPYEGDTSALGVAASDGSAVVRFDNFAAYDVHTLTADELAPP